jgi:hypothetical protein
MSRIYFEEVQKFRDNAWIWILAIAISIATLLPLVNGAYVQLIRGEQWGDKPMSDTGLISLILFMTVTWGLLMLMLFSIKLETKIDEVGIHYRFFPILRQWKQITPNQIVEYKFEQRFRFVEAGGIGYHRNRLNNTRAFRISGRKHLYVKTVDNSKIRIGTQNLEGIEWAMKRLMNKPENF